MRNWKIGQRCDTDTALVPHEELRIVQDFQCLEEYSLTAGDILYLPPGVAHWGIAQGECMTYSIGFRAPRTKDLLSRRADAYLEQRDTEHFYRDPPLIPVGRPGEIRREDIQAAQE